VKVHFMPAPWVPAKSFAPAILAGVSTAACCAQPAIISLGVLPGGAASYANALSADGLVVTGSGTSSVGPRGFRWTSPTGMVSLGLLPSGGSSSVGAAVSADGSVIAGYNGASGNANRAIRWTSAGMVSLGVLGSGSSSTANALSADGAVIAGFSYTSGFSTGRAFRWTAATGMQSLGLLPGGVGDGADAFGMSADGSVIVGSVLANGDAHAFSWTATGGMQDLGAVAGGDSAEAYAVSADGTTAVGHSGDQLNGTFDHAVLWVIGAGTAGLQDLGALGGGLGAGFAQAFAISADHAVVVGSSFVAADRAFLWTAPLGMVDLNTYLPAHGVNLSGWVLTSVRGISADGSALAGYGTFNGAERAFLVSGLSVGSCYPNCDNSNAAPVLNVLDFTCFLQRFAAHDSYANCDSSTTLPTLNVLDFTCFLQKFAAGCP
jgi:probable HAF family extracellular repeat protein